MEPGKPDKFAALKRDYLRDRPSPSNLRDDYIRRT